MNNRLSVLTAHALATASLLSASLCSASFIVNEVKTLDTDGTVTTWDGSTVYTPVSTNNYVTEFTYLDASNVSHTVSTDTYGAFIPSSVTVTATLAIQPTGLGAQAFPDAADYLSAGTGGLSLSTAINVTTKTPPASIEFQISDTSFLNSFDDVLFLGDAADNQSNDSIVLKDSGGLEIGRVDFGPSDWSKLGDHVIDRWDLVNNDLEQGNTQRGVSFTVLTWKDFGIANAAQLADVASIVFSIPQSGLPKTDYAFFGVNTAFIESPDITPPAGVPSPSALLLFGLAGGPMLLFHARSRRKRHDPAVT